MLFQFFLAALTIIAGAVATASAQSLIVGIPSADVTEKGHFVLAHESQGALTRDKMWSSFTFATYGVGKHTELAVSLYGVNYPASNNSAVGVGFKTALPVTGSKFAQKYELKFTIGQMTPISLEGRGVGFWGYGHASIRLPRSRTRLTAGPSYGTRQIFGRNTWKAMVGVEQPVTKKFSIIGDWMSGTHDLGATIVAASYQFNKKFLFITGYKIPNNARSGKPAVIIEFAIDFGKIRK